MDCIKQSGVAGVIEIGAEHDTDALGVQVVDEFAKFGYGAVIFVNLCVVERVVAVVSVVGKIVDGAAARHPAVDLLVDIGHPEHIDAHVGEIALLGFLQHPFEVAPVKCRGIEAFGTIIHDASIVDIIGRIAIAEAVCDDEIDCRIAPVKRLCVGCRDRMHA